jgi:hypothetical protein
MCGQCTNCGMVDTNKIVYQIHVTVDPSTNPFEFKQICWELKVKPVMVFNRGAGHDLITSSIVEDNPYDAMLDIAKKLEEKGFNVVRQKIETVPWNPKIEGMKTHNSYYEAHFTVKTVDITDAEEVGFIAEQHGAKLSFNAQHKYTTYVTLRDREADRDTFYKKFQALLKNLLDFQFEVSKVITEFAVFDSNPDHDMVWMTKY